jgi:uncharacterized lipoprotein
MKPLRGFVAAAVTVIMLCGCAPLVLVGVGAAAGVTGVKYYEGALTAVFQASFDKTWNAAEQALEKRKVDIDLRLRELGSGKLSGHDLSGRPYTVTFEYIAPEETKTVIRVGHLGDKDGSMALKEDMRKILFP